MRRALPGALEDLAAALARLRLTSPGQAVLRLAAAIAVLGAMALVLVPAHAPATLTLLLVLAVLALLLRQTIAPDSSAGLVIVLLIGASVWAGPSLGIPRAIALGLLLFLAHAAWTIAALAPAHARLRPAALRRALPPQAASLLLAVGLGLLVVAPLSALHVGSAATALGGIGCLVLLVLLVARAPRD